MIKVAYFSTGIWYIFRLALTQPTRAELQVFYRAVTFLNETRSIIFITNRELSAWIDAAEDKHLCQTLLDRITVNCQIVRLTDR